MMAKRDFFLFNTVNSVSADADDAALDRVVALCERFEKTFGRFNPESELYRLNHAGGAPTTVSDELAAIISAALGYCERTDGLFDITMGSVTRLWDFHAGTIPARADIDRALEHVNWQNVTVDGSVVTIADPAAWIDLGGIAKGYIADRIIEQLQADGARHILVNLGGNVAVAGGKPDGTPWKVGLRRPASSEATMGVAQSFAVVQLENGSAVTSGTYERAFERDGRLYHHILDPKTGEPAQTDLLSVTVVSKRSLDGDGYTTALIAMGADRALAFCEDLPDVECVAVTTDGDVLATSGIGDAIPFELLG
ncbi:MAG: FAD:protein FMN transferase [Eggerthellaceae bacterium]|jgi:thiamine biosynthesis lipoprotein